MEGFIRGKTIGPDTVTSSEKIIDHPQLKRAKAFALFLARAHAHRHRKPPPSPEDIGPAAFTLLAPTMSREEKRDKLVETLKRVGLTVRKKS